MDLSEVGQLRERVFVSERDIDHPVVDKGGEGAGNGDFLSTTLGARGDKDTAHLSSKSRLAPEWTRCVPESLMNPMRHVARHGVRRTYLPLHREVTIASGNTEKEGVKVDEVVWEKDGVVWAWGCLDELQNVLREGLLDSKRHARSTRHIKGRATTLTGRS